MARRIDPRDIPLPEPTLSLARDLSPEDIEAGIGVRDWLLGEARLLGDFNLVLAGFCERLHGIGVPVERAMTAIETLHAEYSGVGRFWTRGGTVEMRTFAHADDDDGVSGPYARSPFARVHATRAWLVLDVAATPDEAFGVVPDLKRDGFTAYVVAPIFFANGAENGITFATRAPGGFGPRDLGMLRFLVPSFALLMEIRALTASLDAALRTYVGEEPRRAILAGRVRRGRVDRIRSAILFADMRGYTGRAARLSPEEAVELLDAFFDCLVPPIEAGGGEVLKYLGDGLLAIFRDGPGNEDRGLRALAAAREGLAALERAGLDDGPDGPVRGGIALHDGEAAYGNIGSGARLDFTVIGPDVNLASRIGELNRDLNEPLLVSETFLRLLPEGAAIDCGNHDVRGLSRTIGVHRPIRSGSGKFS